MFRRPRVFDVIRVNGRLHVVRSIEYPGGIVETEPLGDMLARSLAVGSDPMTLGDAMIEAGWVPPNEVAAAREP